MGKEKYFVIRHFTSCDEAGDTYVTPFSRKGLIKEIADYEKEWQENGYKNKRPNILGHCPKADTQYWKDGWLVIKGEIIKKLPENE